MSTIAAAGSPATAPEPFAEAATTPGRDDEAARTRRLPLALSPSRATDFKQCPLLYRYRAIDRFPETPSRAQTRGIVVHAALENLFQMPATLRTRDAAELLAEGAWAALCEGDPELAAVAGPDGDAAFLDEIRRLIATYYTMEDPTAFDADHTEEHVEVRDGEVPLRGFIDRVDVAPTGHVRLVDYKTGRSPGGNFEGRALFQMRFYALAILRTRGVVPDLLQLMYLSDGQTLTYTPDVAELERFARTLAAIWAAIGQAVRTGDFRPHRTRLCALCGHKARCPEFGGTAPDYPGPPADFA